MIYNIMFVENAELGFGLRKREQSGKHEFDKLCAELDIEHRLTPPGSPQTNGMVERFNGRIEDVLQSHHFRSGEELETTLHRYVWRYNQQLPQSALGSKTPLQAMKDCHKLKPELFNNQPYYCPGCDTYAPNTIINLTSKPYQYSFLRQPLNLGLVQPILNGHFADNSDL